MGDRLRRATHLHIRSIAFINPVGRIAPGATADVAAAAGPAIIASTTAVLVVLPLAWPMSIIEIQIITSAKSRPVY